ncbi:polyphosphate polymerase domain-containing protein [Haloferula sargassicola]|uniref:VTC domain-containing protein n=1 Tax=Haloferula sargassicola TaxID=490096 RepID=A0ABP9UME6_9BACT
MDAHQDRREFKFLLPREKFEVVRAEVAEFLSVDRGARDGYRILSEYFDSDDRDSYWEKVFGLPNRRRIRTRVYGTPGSGRALTRFIEIKHKQDGLTVKRRLPACDEELEAFVKGELPEQAEEEDLRVHAELAELLQRPPKSPVVRIQYHRFAYDSGVDGTIRITFDTDVRCGFAHVRLCEDAPEPELPLLDEGWAIMEVKTIGPVPYWFRSLIGKHSISPQGFSKYAVALERYELGKNPPLPLHDPEQPVRRHCSIQ